MHKPVTVSGAVVAAGCAAVFALLSASTSSAQIPSATGVFEACIRLDRIDDAARLVRLVAAGEPCNRNETRVKWNVAGAPGPQGPQGLIGPAGPAGPAGANGTNGLNGANGTNGTNGINGANGANGVNGNSVRASLTPYGGDPADPNICVSGSGHAFEIVDGSGTLIPGSRMVVCDGTTGAQGPPDPLGQQIATAVALNAADIARNSLDISRNSADIARNSADIAALQGSQSASYGFADYIGATVATKTFSTSGGLCGNTEIEIFTRTPQPDGSMLLTIDQDRRLGPNRCAYLSTRFRVDDSGMALEGTDTRNTADPTVTLTSANLDVPIPTLLSSMRIGATFGSASRSTLVNFVQGGTTSIGFNNVMVTLLAVVDVTVPAGTFTDCLRVSEVRNTAHFGVLTQTDWICRGLGVVRRLVASNALATGNVTLTGGYLLELQSYTTQ